MNDSSILTKEIIKRIMANCGIGHQKNFGLLKKEFLLKNSLPLEYDDVTYYEHRVFAGETVLQKFKLRAMVVDLSMSASSIPEFCLAFRLEELPIHGLRLVFDDEDMGIFKIKQANNWIDATVSIQAMALNGMEHVISLGLAWAPTAKTDDLYQAVSSLCTL